MDLNDLLQLHGINPQKVIVLRHRPMEPELRKVLKWLAADRPEIYNAYQQTQGDKLEASMKRADYVASFIGHEPGKALFIGLYENQGAKPLTRKQYWQVAAYRELMAYGIRGFSEQDPRSSILWFELGLTGFYSDWKGKLIVQWPGLERSWWRWADRNRISVVAVLEDSELDEAMPEWSRIVLSWNQLALLPKRWESVLREWRGIYYIFDSSDRMGYVGAAYGRHNLLGRWENYAKSGHGGNRQLRNRDPGHFQFSVLQRVSPDMDGQEVIDLESTWKDRLHTRSPFGLNVN